MEIGEFPGEYEGCIDPVSFTGTRRRESEAQRKREGNSKGDGGFETLESLRVDARCPATPTHGPFPRLHLRDTLNVYTFLHYLKPRCSTTVPSMYFNIKSVFLLLLLLTIPFSPHMSSPLFLFYSRDLFLKQIIHDFLSIVIC